MPMIVGTRLFHKPPTRTFHGVGIVKTKNPPIAGVVHGQFVSNAVRPRLIRFNFPSPDLDPVSRPDPDVRSVEIQKDG